MSPNEICDLVASAGVAQRSEIEGCSKQEIDLLRETQGVLPASYVAFLQALGHRAGRLLAGTEAFYRHLPLLRAEATELLEENGLALPNNAFVFYMHQGYEVGYFLLGDNDDPPVFQYVEGANEPVVAWPSFSAYLLDIVRQHELAA